MYSSNSQAFMDSLDDFLPKFERDLEFRLARIVHYAHQSLMDKTAVQTGLTVRNYIVTMDIPLNFTGVAPAIQSPPRPGATNKLALGMEPRRAANEAAAAATLSNIEFNGNPYRAIYISNNSPTVFQMEMGLAPLPSDTLTPRTWGMFELTFSEIVSKLTTGSL